MSNPNRRRDPHHKINRSGRRSGRLLAALLVAATSLLSVHSQAQRPAPGSAPNMDLRTEKTAAASRLLAQLASRLPDGFSANQRDRQEAAVARLKGDFDELEVLNSPELLTPEVVGAKPGFGFLTGPSTDRVATLRGFLGQYAAAYGLASGASLQSDELALVADYENPSGNMAFVELEQRINGLPVFRGLLRGAFTAKGELARTVGALASGIDPSTLSVSPVIDARAAIATAASRVGWAVNASALTVIMALMFGPCLSKASMRFKYSCTTWRQVR